MAAAAFAALVSLDNNLHLIQNHPRHSFSFENQQIQSLSKTVDFLIHFLQSYDNSHGHRHRPRNNSAELPLGTRIARAAHAAEDVIESHVVDQLRSGKTTSKSSPRFLLDLQKAIAAMDYMRRKAINMIKVQQIRIQPSTNPINSLRPSKKNTPMVGFHDLLLQLLDSLTGHPSARRVIPVVGMGGIGKTTLARNAFENPLIVQRFDVRLWATISQQFRVERILVELLSQYLKTSDSSVDCGNGNADEMREKLYKSLYGRRYLIVLDDMWSIEAWIEINRFLPDTYNGSRVVVTTRHSDVANRLGFSSLAMTYLNEHHSWDLFCQKAFVDSQSCPHELEGIGKKIVEKCKGLPLTIVVVGGHLRKSPTTREYWEVVAEHMKLILDSEENEEHCMNVLYLSYSYLPLHLKPCFLLMGAFQENEEIYSWDILKLWIAEGFIQCSESTRLEVTAEEYLEDLLERNLITVDELGFNEEIMNFKLHDLLRELCVKISKEEEFLYVLDTPQAINRERRVVINKKVTGMMNHQTRNAPIRCLVCQGGWPSSDFRLLRVLNKVDRALTNESIFKQVNLRYLKVDVYYKTRPTHYLPSSISLLWNLQILTISLLNLSTIVAPYEIWEMLQLRHLEIDPVCLLDPLPTDHQENDMVMRNLDTLSKVENFRLSDEVCKRISNIRELQLSYTSTSASSDEDEDEDEARSSYYYCPHNLGNFHELMYLVCNFHGDSRWRDFALCFTFPSSLVWLNLSGCRLHWDDLGMMAGSLPNLVNLLLYPDSVVGDAWTPNEGEFLRLKSLEIYGCDDLVYWNADSSHFPVLENLQLSNLSKLDEFPSDIGEIATLGRVVMDFCSLSSTISAMRTLVEQEEQGNEGLRLYVAVQGDEEMLENFNKKVKEEGLKSNNLSLFHRNVKLKSV